MLIRVLVTALLSIALVACGGGDGSASAAGDDNTVASLEWVTPAPMFTASGQSFTLQARALNASGQVLNVPIRWQSSEPTAVSVDGNPTGPIAKVTSQASQGTAHITASAGGRTLTAIAIAITPAAGTVVLADTQIEGAPQATSANAPLRVGSTYTVQLKAGEPAPSVGQLVIGQGNKAVAGEVVAVNGQTVTLAMVPLQRLLPHLQLDLDLPLVANATAASTSKVAASGATRTNMVQGKVRAQAETSFSVAGFDCDAEGSAGGVELAKKDVSPFGLDTLRYRVLWNSSQKMLRLSGQPGVQFELEPSAKIAFTGKVDCKLELADVPIPLPPTIGLFLGVGFPVGVGFTMEGALPVNGVALNLKGQAQATVVVGFDCNPTCNSLNSITPSGSVTPTLTAPEFTANSLDLSGQVYAWANFEGGARWSSTLQFDAIEAQAGLKFTTKVATENAQAKEAASAGDYKLSFEASAGPTEALGDMADLVGLILDHAKFETSVPLGRSPTATFTADKTSFKTGDDVKFQVDLNSDEVLFPLQGYNVQSVRVYRKTVADDGSYVLVLANEQRASSGQTQFTIPWLATVDSASNISFVAFVQTKLLNDLRWQAGLVQTQTIVTPGTFRGRVLYTNTLTYSGDWTGSKQTTLTLNVEPDANGQSNVFNVTGIGGTTGTVTSFGVYRSNFGCFADMRTNNTTVYSQPDPTQGVKGRLFLDIDRANNSWYARSIRYTTSSMAVSTSNRTFLNARGEPFGSDAGGCAPQTETLTFDYSGTNTDANFTLYAGATPVSEGAITRGADGARHIRFSSRQSYSNALGPFYAGGLGPVSTTGIRYQENGSLEVLIELDEVR